MHAAFALAGQQAQRTLRVDAQGWPASASPCIGATTTGSSCQACQCCHSAWNGQTFVGKLAQRRRQPVSSAAASTLRDTVTPASRKAAAGWPTSPAGSRFRPAPITTADGPRRRPAQSGMPASLRFAQQEVIGPFQPHWRAQAVQHAGQATPTTRLSPGQLAHAAFKTPQ